MVDRRHAGDPAEKGRHRWFVNIKESATDSKRAVFFREVTAPLCEVTQKDGLIDYFVCSGTLELEEGVSFVQNVLKIYILKTTKYLLSRGPIHVGLQALFTLLPKYFYLIS